MRSSNKPDPSKLSEWGIDDIEGKASDLIAKLQKIVDQHPNATISCELDYRYCYYEGDTPMTIFKVRSK